MKPSPTEGTWIVPEDARRPTPNAHRPDHHATYPIDAVVWHFTVSGSLEGTARWLQNLRAKASYHFLVGRAGEVFQLLPLEWRAWHAGHRSAKLLGRGNPNGRSIGVGLINYGPVSAVSDAKTGQVISYQTPGGVAEIPPYDVEHTEPEPQFNGHTAWQVYPSSQVAASIALARRLADLFPVLRSPDHHVGHNEVDNARDEDGDKRKIDPGPLFPWTDLSRALTAEGPDLGLV